MGKANKCWVSMEIASGSVDSLRIFQVVSKDAEFYETNLLDGRGFRRIGGIDSSLKRQRVGLFEIGTLLIVSFFFSYTTSRGKHRCSLEAPYLLRVTPGRTETVTYGDTELKFENVELLPCSIDEWADRVEDVKQEEYERGKTDVWFRMTLWYRDILSKTCEIQKSQESGEWTEMEEKEFKPACTCF
ncbi:MAG: hypothetical protein QXJ27_03505 [Thermoplasmata archaeon]